MKIAAVVVTFNRLELLKECVNALRKQTRHLDEIIVVDNGSSDETPRWLEEQNDLIVISQSNLGSSGGQHTSIRVAYERGNDWIWVMDDDAEPKLDALQHLMEVQKYQPNVAALCCKKIGLDGKIQYEHRGVFKGKSGIEPISEALYSTQREIEVDICSFVGILINRNAVEKCGLPEKDFFIWYDDVEYSLRLRKFGKIILCPNSVILHKDNTTVHKKTVFGKDFMVLPIELYWKQLCGIRNYVFLMKRHENVSTIWVWLYFMKRVIKILLLEDNKWFRIQWVYKYIKQGINTEFKNITPQNWRGIIKYL